MKRIWVAISLALVAIMLTSTVALAFLTSPTSISIVSTKAFRNLAETGDMLVTVHYKVEYTSYPTTPASNTIILRLYGIDGTTILSQAQPYNFSSFATYGYGDGIASFYFDAATAPAWGIGYFINLLETPAYFSPANSVTYEMTAGDFSTATTQTDAQYDLYNTIMAYCVTFHTIYATVPLQADTGSTQVLSVYGEPYFRAVIPGLQTLSPQCFYAQVLLPSAMAESYSMNATMTTSTLAGSDMERGAQRIGVSLGGLSANAIFGAIFFILCVVICVVCYRHNWGVEPALLVCALLLIGAGSIVKDFFFTLTMILGFAGGMAISYILLFRRA